jgi:hypothetical protein
METKNTSKNSFKFFCEKCDFKCCKKGDYNKHLLTRKHNKEANGDKKNSAFICENCDKVYLSRGSLWKHEKKCFENIDYNKDKEKEPSNETPGMITPEIVVKLLTQNQELLTSNNEFKELIVEQQQELSKLQNKILETENKLIEAVKDGKTINNTTNNNCNNKFNLNFFLNEQCKNAMNISEFINTMVLSVEDLKNTGKLGYIDGITKIFTDKLRELDTCNRPMHCTDLKRETLYIKNNDEWTKDTEDKRKIKTAIECVANKNLNNLDNWKEENPNHVIMDSKEDKEFVEIMTNSLGGMGTDREKNKQKIIKNVLKEVIVDK